ncbi:MAG TPA: Ig-like domain-containing protein [Cyclobacteriaceae bacterium]|nr:Ig-like domain-containing protein [Cyclobacteriaceae bacterium]
MKLRHSMIAFVLALGAGCDTMENDPDGQLLAINNDPAYFLPGGDGFIDLGARIVSPGKIKVEITGTTRNGNLKDLGKGLLQYSPKSNAHSDSFSFRVLSSDNKILGEDSIGIVIPTDTTHLPCKGVVYTRPDTVKNVTGPVTVDVLANDYACSAAVTVSINVAPEHGTAVMVGNKIRYTPGSGFTGYDNLLYKAVTSDPSAPAGYAMLAIRGPGAGVHPPDVTNPPDTTATNPSCFAKANADTFIKALNDTTAIYLDVLANDVKCDSLVDLQVLPGLGPRNGTAWADNSRRKIGYKNFANSNKADTLWYEFGGKHGGGVAKVVIKRQ